MYSRWLILVELSNVLGLKAEIKECLPKNISKLPGKSEIEFAIQERLSAKANRNFSKADEIRETLKSQGIELIDKNDGTTEWISN